MTEQPAAAVTQLMIDGREVPHPPPRPRATCPECGKTITLTDRGEFRSHTVEAGFPCPTSGRRIGAPQSTSTMTALLTVVRVLTIVALSIALIAAVVPTTIIATPWYGWTDAGLLGLAISLLLPTLAR